MKEEIKKYPDNIVSRLEAIKTTYQRYGISNPDIKKVLFENFLDSLQQLRRRDGATEQFGAYMNWYKDKMSIEYL